jgi:putative Ca2+/H+ antiporter (TMEM165/GDT1 family)
METGFLTVGIGLISELGDRSQLLLFALSMQFRQRTELIAGMLLATILTHSMAGLAGGWIAAAIEPRILDWALAAMFFAAAVWSLTARLTADLRIVRMGGVFLTVFVTFSLIELGDRSNFAAAALSAHPGLALQAVIGTVIGVAIVNIPIAVYGPVLAEKLVARDISMARIGRPAAILFVLLGVMTLAGAGIR